jgi:hypothetical protein
MNDLSFNRGASNTLFFEVAGTVSVDDVVFSMAENNRPDTTIICQYTKANTPSQIAVTSLGKKSIVQVNMLATDIMGLNRKLYKYDIRGVGSKLLTSGQLRCIFGVKDSYNDNTRIEAAYGNFREGVSLTPEPNGTNKIFAIPVTSGRKIVSGTEKIYLGTTRLVKGVSYTINGATVTLFDAPAEADSLTADWIEVDISSNDSFSNFKIGIYLTPDPDGVNLVFTIPVTAGKNLIAGKEAIFNGGTRLTRDVSYTIDGNVITFINDYVPDEFSTLIGDWIEK